LAGKSGASLLGKLHYAPEVQELWRTEALEVAEYFVDGRTTTLSLKGLEPHGPKEDVDNWAANLQATTQLLPLVARSQRSVEPTGPRVLSELSQTDARRLSSLLLWIAPDEAEAVPDASCGSADYLDSSLFDQPVRHAVVEQLTASKQDRKRPDLVGRWGAFVKTVIEVRGALAPDANLPATALTREAFNATSTSAQERDKRIVEVKAGLHILGWLSNGRAPDIEPNDPRLAALRTASTLRELALMQLPPGKRALSDCTATTESRLERARRDLADVVDPFRNMPIQRALRQQWTRLVRPALGYDAERWEAFVENRTTPEVCEVVDALLAAQVVVDNLAARAAP